MVTVLGHALFHHLYITLGSIIAYRSYQNFYLEHIIDDNFCITCTSCHVCVSVCL